VSAAPEGQSRPRAQANGLARFAPAAIPLLLIPALGAVQGGFQPDAWVWSGALAAWAAALALVLGAGADRLRRDRWWALSAGALLLWTLASRLWSANSAQSLLEARRMTVYAAVVLALVVLARRHSTRLLLAGTHAGITALVLYALARYLLGSRTFYSFEGYLLSEPLGYANAVGILSAMGVLLSVGLVADSASRGVRAAAGAMVPLFALALVLTGSRASWLALAIGLAATTLLHPRSLSLMRTLTVLAPATAIAIWMGYYSELSTASSPRLGGLVVAIAAVGCAVVAAGAAAVTLPRLDSSPNSRPRAFVVGGTAVIALLGAVAVVAAEATEPRSLYYHVAWREFLAHPLFGSGAGTFGHYWLRWGDVGTWGGALDAHSLYLETLAELGPIGLCLLGTFLLYPLRRTVAHRSLPFVPAAAGAAIAFLVHAGLDWDWEMPAVVVAGLACAAGVAFAEPAGEGDESSPTLPAAVRAAALVAALLAGVAAIAGARSTTEPAAGPLMWNDHPLTIEAPRSGASNRTTS
jgi:O-antigen ligase